MRVFTTEERAKFLINDQREIREVAGYILDTVIGFAEDAKLFDQAAKVCTEVINDLDFYLYESVEVPGKDGQASTWEHYPVTEETILSDESTMSWFCDANIGDLLEPWADLVLPALYKNFHLDDISIQNRQLALLVSLLASEEEFQSQDFCEESGSN